MDKSLRQIYYDPVHPASFGSAYKLYRSIRLINPFITLKDVKNWLKGENTYTLHKQARRHFKRNRILAEVPGEQFQADLVDMSMFSRQNKGYKYILTVIDVFSKYAWGIPVKTKSGADIRDALLIVFKDKVPLKLQTDRGKEFLNSPVQKIIKQNNINFFTSNKSDVKCAIVERFNRTLKSKMFKYFSAKGTRMYLDILPLLVNSYNRSKHRMTGMRPIDVTIDNAADVFYKLYGVRSMREYLRKLNFGKYNVNDMVRRKYELNPLEKSYYPLWTDQVYTIAKTIKGPVPMYYLKDERGNILPQKFYSEELQQVTPKEYRVKVLRERIRNGRKEYLVHWIGYPETYNSWVSNLIKLK